MKLDILSAALFALVVALPAQANEDADSAASAKKSADIARTNEIAMAIWPLKQANVELCGKEVGPSFGFQSALSPENKPLVLGIGEGSPAQLGGLQNYDELVAINDVEFGTAEQEQLDQRYRDVLDEQANLGREVKVKYLRNGVESVATITPVTACSFTVTYESERDPFSASLEGNNLVLDEDIDAYAHSPEQIRAFLSSALARILLTEQWENAEENPPSNHAAAMETEEEDGVPKHVADRLRIALKQNLQQDYLSVYLLARTGDDVSGIADFWSGVFSNQKGSPMMRSLMSKWSGFPERLAKIAETRDEVLALQKAGKPLLPARDHTEEKN